MTTDYQNFSGDKWEELCDVTCIRTNILPNFHTILHYFTLKDPQARGCVRPSCLAYITQDLNKLHYIKQDILGVLNMSAQVLKHSNLRWLKQQMQSLEIKENNSITILLDKWNHLSRPVLESHTNKPTSWASLCSSGIHLVVSGFTQINYNQINNKFDELNWIKCVVTAAKLIIVNYDWRLRIAEVIQHHEPIIRKPYHRSQEINSIIRPLRQNTYLRRGIPTNNEEFWRRKLDS